MLRPPLRLPRLRWPRTYEILRVGAVASLITVTTTLAVAVATGLVGSYGPAAVAGYGTGVRLEYLIPTRGGAPQQTAEQRRTQIADELSFARCMRSQGLTRFPDPTAQGQLTVEMVQGQGIDLHSPAVLQAVQACLPASHGLLTPAKVRAALNHAGG